MEDTGILIPKPLWNRCVKAMLQAVQGVAEEEEDRRLAAVEKLRILLNEIDQAGLGR